MPALDEIEAQGVASIEEPLSISPRYIDNVSVAYTLEFNLYHRV